MYSKNEYIQTLPGGRSIKVQREEQTEERMVPYVPPLGYPIKGVPCLPAERIQFFPVTLSRKYRLTVGEHQTSWYEAEREAVLELFTLLGES
jgi:hypothetical protein